MAMTQSWKSTPQTSKKNKTLRDITQPTASSGTPSPCSTAGQKRQQSSNQASSSGKQWKTRSLMTEDIPEIVLAQPGPGTVNPAFSRGKMGTSRPAS